MLFRLCPLGKPFVLLVPLVGAVGVTGVVLINFSFRPKYSDCWMPGPIHYTATLPQNPRSINLRQCRRKLTGVRMMAAEDCLHPRRYSRSRYSRKRILA